MTTSIIIEEIKKEEIDILKKFLYEAVFIREGEEKPPFEIIYSTDIYVYIDDFGNCKNDYCLVAKNNEKIVGAVWSRVLNGKIKGYGNIDNNTPEIAISLLKEYRNQGIGTQLLVTLLNNLLVKEYGQISLSVDKENYAVKLYEKVGFRILQEREHDYLMVFTYDNFVKKNT